MFCVKSSLESFSVRDINERHVKLPIFAIGIKIFAIGREIFAIGRRESGGRKVSAIP